MHSEFLQKQKHTVTKEDVWDAHDFISSTDRLTGIDRNGTENSSDTYQLKIHLNVKSHTLFIKFAYAILHTFVILH